MRTYAIYCDASGQAKSGDILCVSGFGSTASRWLKFEQRWDVLLRKYNITPPFHTTDFLNGVGQYASWKQDQEKRKNFQSIAIEIMRRSINKCFSVSIAVDDLRKNQSEYQLPGKINEDNTYVWCLFVFYVQIGNWLKQHAGARDKIEVIFESGDLGQLAFPKRFLEVHPTLKRPVFRDKKLAPLQAADMLAYEIRKDIIRQSKGLSPRKSLIKMRRVFPHQWRHFTLEDLSQLCEKAQFQKRNN